MSESPLYRHLCPFCRHTWASRVAPRDVPECPRCGGYLAGRRVNGKLIGYPLPHPAPRNG